MVDKLRELKTSNTNLTPVRLSEVTITEAVDEYGPARVVGAGATPPPPPPNASTRRFLCVILAESPRTGGKLSKIVWPLDLSRSL